MGRTGTVKRCGISFALALLAPFCLPGQAAPSPTATVPLLVLDTILTVPNHLRIFPFYASIDITGDTLWFYPGRSRQRGIVWIYCYSFRHHRWDSSALEGLDVSNRSPIRALAVHPATETLCIIAGKYLYQFSPAGIEFSGNRGWTLSNHEELTQMGFRPPRRLPDGSLGFSFWGYTSSSLLSGDTLWTTIEFYHPQTGQGRILKLPNPEGLLLTLFTPPFEPALSSRFIAVPEISTYRITIYNFQGDAVDTIYRQPPHWTSSARFALLRDSLHQLAISHQAGDVLRILRPLFYQEMSSIQRVEFLTDSLLLVTWWQQDRSPATPAKRIADLWYLTPEGHWILVLADYPLPQHYDQLDTARIPLTSDWFFAFPPSKVAQLRKDQQTGKYSIVLWRINTQYLKALRSRFH